MDNRMEIEEENFTQNIINKENQKQEENKKININENNQMEEEKDEKEDIKTNYNSIDFIIKDNNIIFDKNILKFENQPPILAPRDYQLKIYEKAKKQNSIIYLETGRGKTFISIMLMANLLNIRLPLFENPIFDKNIKIIFLVCDTALIEQQKNNISANLKTEVGTIQGKKIRKQKVI